jgi:hypothetical protein
MVDGDSGCDGPDGERDHGARVANDTERHSGNDIAGNRHRFLWDHVRYRLADCATTGLVGNFPSLALPGWGEPAVFRLPATGEPESGLLG